jgi:hypothetical protein
VGWWMRGSLRKARSGSLLFTGSLDWIRRSGVPSTSEGGRGLPRFAPPAAVWPSADLIRSPEDSGEKAPQSMWLLRAIAGEDRLFQRCLRVQYKAHNQEIPR